MAEAGLDEVDEVNWTKWNTNLGIINEDPGNCKLMKDNLNNSSLRIGRAKTWKTFVPHIREFSIKGKRAKEPGETGVPLQPISEGITEQESYEDGTAKPM